MCAKVTISLWEALQALMVWGLCEDSNRVVYMDRWADTHNINIIKQKNHLNNGCLAVIKRYIGGKTLDKSTRPISGIYRAEWLRLQWLTTCDPLYLGMFDDRGHRLSMCLHIKTDNCCLEVQMVHHISLMLFICSSFCITLPCRLGWSILHLFLKCQGAPVWKCDK